VKIKTILFIIITLNFVTLSAFRPVKPLLHVLNYRFDFAKCCSQIKIYKECPSDLLALKEWLIEHQDLSFAQYAFATRIEQLTHDNCSNNEMTTEDRHYLEYLIHEKQVPVELYIQNTAKNNNTTFALTAALYYDNPALTQFLLHHYKSPVVSAIPAHSAASYALRLGREKHIVILHNHGAKLFPKEYEKYRSEWEETYPAFFESILSLPLFKLKPMGPPSNFANLS